MLMLAVLHQLGFSGNRDAMGGIGTAIVFAIVMAATALANPAKAFQRNVLG